MPAAPQSSLNESNIKSLGIIAGGGVLPARLLGACDRRGMEVFIVGFEGQTDRALVEGRNYMFTRLGAAGQIINTLKSHGISDIVLIGSIKRPGLAELRPDLRTAQFFAKVGLRALGDDGLLKAIRYELEKEGFRIHGVQQFVADLIAHEGPVGARRPDKGAQADIQRGREVLRAIGPADVGQSVIVQDGIVLGVEAAEGTDELIRRCKSYKRHTRGGVLIKAAKPGQDTDLDLPSVGPETVRLCAECGLDGIAFEAGRTLLIDPQEVAEIADGKGLFVTGYDAA